MLCSLLLEQRRGREGQHCTTTSENSREHLHCPLVCACALGRRMYIPAAACGVTSRIQHYGTETALRLRCLPTIVDDFPLRKLTPGDYKGTLDQESSTETWEGCYDQNQKGSITKSLKFMMVLRPDLGSTPGHHTGSMNLVFSELVNTLKIAMRSPPHPKRCGL